MDLIALETKKKDAPDPHHSSHGIRENENENPLWYRELCASYLVDRKEKVDKIGRRRKGKRRRKDKFIDTKIRGIAVQMALRTIIKNGYSYSPYAEIFFDIARELKEEEERANELSKKGCDIKEISEDCRKIMDLASIPVPYDRILDRTFEIAEGFRNSLEERLKSYGDEPPF
jgi:hypothetical protein